MTAEAATEHSDERASRRRGARRALVAGLGVSGLSAAHFLLVRGALRAGDVLELREARAGVGGVLTHTARDGFLLEHGAQGVLSSRPAFTRLVRALGLEGECLGSSPRARARYLATPEGTLVRVSPSPLPWLRAGLLSFGQWLRAMGEWRVRARTVPDPTETFYDFFARRFGEALARRVAIPVATGIWAGGARSILVSKAFPTLVEWDARGGVIRGALRMVGGRFLPGGAAPRALPNRGPESAPTALPKGLLTFRGGMITLPEALLADVRTRCARLGVHLVEKRDSPIASLGAAAAETGDSSRSGIAIDGESYDAVVLAFAPWSGPGVRWLDDRSRPHWEALRDGMTRHGVVVVGLGGTLPAGFAAPRGFGALEPDESACVLGILNVHDINPSHVPPVAVDRAGTGDLVLYRVLLGGDRDPEAVRREPDHLAETARAELERLGFLPRGFVPSFTETVRWPACIALPDAKQDALVPTIWTLEALVPGLFLAGNYVKGVGVADCIERAEEVAARVEASFGRDPVAAKASA